MTNLEAAKHFRIQLDIANEYDAIVPTEYIQDIYKRFTNAFSALICELMDAKNITASEASKKAENLLRNEVA